MVAQSAWRRSIKELMVCGIMATWRTMSFFAWIPVTRWTTGESRIGIAGVSLLFKLSGVVSTTTRSTVAIISLLLGQCNEQGSRVTLCLPQTGDAMRSTIARSFSVRDTMRMTSSLALYRSAYKHQQGSSMRGSRILRDCGGEAGIGHERNDDERDPKDQDRRPI